MDQKHFSNFFPAVILTEIFVLVSFLSLSLEHRLDQGKDFSPLGGCTLYPGQCLIQQVVGTLGRERFHNREPPKCQSALSLN